MVFSGVPNTFCQEKHQDFHADRQLVTKKEISIKINFKDDNKRSWPSGVITGLSRATNRLRLSAGAGILFFSFFFFLI